MGRDRRLVHDRDLGRGGGPVARPARRPPRRRPSRRRSAAGPRREPGGQRLDRRRRPPRASCRGSSRSPSSGSPRSSSASTTWSRACRRRGSATTSRRSSTRSSAASRADRILAVETPDYTVTPMGAAFGEPAAQRAGIVAFNAVLAALCAERGITFVDGILADLDGRGRGPRPGRVRRAPPVGGAVPPLGRRADRAGRPAACWRVPDRPGAGRRRPSARPPGVSRPA